MMLRPAGRDRHPYHVAQPCSMVRTVEEGMLTRALSRFFEAHVPDAVGHVHRDARRPGSIAVRGSKRCALPTESIEDAGTGHRPASPSPLVACKIL